MRQKDTEGTKMMSGYEEKLALKALRRFASGKKPTYTGKRAMMNMGYINDDGDITPLGKQVLRVRG